MIAFEVVDDPGSPGSVQASASALAVVTVTAPPAIAQPPVAQDTPSPGGRGAKDCDPGPPDHEHHHRPSD